MTTGHTSPGEARWPGSRFLGGASPTKDRGRSSARRGAYSSARRSGPAAACSSAATRGAKTDIDSSKRPSGSGPGVVSAAATVGPASRKTPLRWRTGQVHPSSPCHRPMAMTAQGPPVEDQCRRTDTVRLGHLVAPARVSAAGLPRRLASSTSLVSGSVRYSLVSSSP